MSWDAGLADKAQIPIAELRAYEAIFKQLDPQGEGEINVTKCDHQINLNVMLLLLAREALALTAASQVCEERPRKEHDGPHTQLARPPTSLFRAAPGLLHTHRVHAERARGSLR